MPKLLAVYNTCGIGGRVNVDNYITSLESLVAQDFNDMHIALSSCLNNPGEIQLLKHQFGDTISYNCIYESVPISVTFNHTVEKCIEKFGEFDSYLFIDSGVNFVNSPTGVRELFTLFESGPYGSVAARTDDDMGFDNWFNTDMRGDSLFDNGDLVVPLGSAVNLHAQIFSKEWQRAYGRILPDIFAGQCMESVFSFMCAAIKSKWVVSKNVILHHRTGMDGPSSGFAPHLWEIEGNNRWDHLFGTNEPILDIISRGKEFGMGYEEVQKICLHRDDQFDENGYCTNDNLALYIKDNLFLRSDQFNYDGMVYNFT